MKNSLSKIALVVAFGFAFCFAQNAPEKLAVYVSGAGDAGVSRSLGGKLLATMSQGGAYAEITDPTVFQNELASSGKGDIAYVAQAAKQHGADYVCSVNMTETLGAYYITARLVRVSDLQVLKTGSTDRALRTLDDLTAVSNELARQLLSPGSHVPAPIAPAAPVAAAAPLPVLVSVPAAPAVPASESGSTQCDKNYNVNELLFKVQNGFPVQLKDCSSKLAKDMLSPFGKKLEPKSFMLQCPIDGIKKELPAGFPGTDKILGSLANFVQGLLNSASAGGSLDPKKLVSSVGSMDITGLLNDLKQSAIGECVVDEPYEPSAVSTPAPVPTPMPAPVDKADNSDSRVSFGIRAGFNNSHTYAEYYIKNKKGSGDYSGILGGQAGLVVDFALSDWFHIQPGLMYISKGMNGGNDNLHAHYLDIPLLLSFKFSVVRLNAGPYFGFCMSGSYCNVFDTGLNAGVGFDIKKFYIGTVYEHGLVDVSSKPGFRFYNRTYGINFGVNL